MLKQDIKNITLPRSAIKEEQGIVILTLEKWKKIEMALEDLEMYSSNKLAKEIEEIRKEKETVPLNEVLKKYDVE